IWKLHQVKQGFDADVSRGCEPFPVFHSDLTTETARPTLHLVKKVVVGQGGFELIALGIVKLGAESFGGCHVYLRRIGSVDHHVGRDDVVLQIMIQSSWSPSFLWVSIDIGFDRFESRQKPGIVYELGSTAVIRMSVVGGISDENFWLAGADHFYDLHLFGFGTGKKAIAETEIDPKSRSLQPGCFFGLPKSYLRCATCAEFSLGKIQDPK